MNMISTGAFQTEIASKDTESLVSKLVAAWEKKNAKVARSGGISLIALSLAACGSSSSDDTTASTTDTTTVSTEPTTPVTAAAVTEKFTTALDTLTGDSGDDTFNGVYYADGGTGTTAFPGDTVDAGDGSDTLNISVAGTSTAGNTVAAISTTGVEKLYISNYDANANDAHDTTIDTSLMTGLTTLGLTSSNATGDTAFTNVAAIAGAEMKNGAGDMDITYIATAVAGTADTQVVEISNVSAGTFTSNAIETITINTSLVKSTIDNVASDALTTVNVTGNVDLTVSTAIDFVAGTNNDTTIDATIDASAFTGKLTVTADANDHAITGGSGNDTINMVALLNSNDHIDGGGGTDTLTMNAAALTTQFTNVSNIENLTFNADDAATAAVAYDFSKLSADMSTVRIDINDNGNNANDHTITKHTTQAIEIRNSAQDASSLDSEVVITNAVDSTSDAISIKIIEAIEDSDKRDIETLNVANYETVNLESSKLATTVTAIENNIDAITASSATTMNLSGNSAMQIDAITGGKMTVFDASNLAAKLEVTFSSNDKITATAAQNDTVFAMGANLDNNDTIKGGAGTKDSLTATLSTGATATTGALSISDVETITLTTGADNTLNLTNVTGATSIGVTTNAQTITGYDLGATLFSTGNSGTVTVTARDATGTDDTLTIEQRLADNGNDARTVSAKTGIENLSILLNDQDATAANTATFTLTNFAGSKITASQVATTATNSLETANLAMGTLHKNVNTVDTSGTKGTQAFSITNATSAGDIDLSGAAAATITTTVYADTIDITSSGAVDHTIASGTGADVVNIAVKNGYVTSANIDAETINYTVAVGEDITLTGVNNVATTAITLAGGNSLSTFTTAANGIVNQLTSFDASGFGGNVVLKSTADIIDSTVSFKAGALLTDEIEYAMTATGTDTLVSEGIEILDLNVDDTSTLNLAGAVGVKTIDVDIATTKTLTLDKLTGSENVLITAAATNSGTVEAKLASTASITDSIAFELKGASAAAIANTTALKTTDINNVTVKASSAETVDLSNLSMSLAADVMTLNATGSFALTASALNADVTTVDASGMGEGGSFVQSARSATAASTYTGSAGNDTFIMMNTADAITGGAGTGDTLDVNFTAVLGAIAVDLSATGDQVTTMNGLANTGVQSGFENVDLSGYSGKGASVTGSSAANTIIGTSQADTFDGGGGIDTITGGIGNDTYSTGASDAANDIVVIAFATDGVDIIQDFNFGASGDTLQLTLGSVVNDTSTNAGAINGGVDGGTVAVSALAANTAVSATSTAELHVCAEDLTTVTINSTKTAIEAEAATQLADTTDAQANAANGEGALFMMDNGTDSFLFLVEETATGVGTTNAAEVALLAIFTGLDAENVHTDNFV
jgi:hypothetical protein